MNLLHGQQKQDQLKVEYIFSKVTLTTLKKDLIIKSMETPFHNIFLISLHISSMSETICDAKASLLCSKFVSKFYIVRGVWTSGFSLSRVPATPTPKMKCCQILGTLIFDLCRVPVS